LAARGQSNKRRITAMKIAARIAAGTFQLAAMLALSIIGIPAAIVVVIMGLCLACVVAVLSAIPFLFLLVGL